MSQGANKMCEAGVKIEDEMADVHRVEAHRRWYTIALVLALVIAAAVVFNARAAEAARVRPLELSETLENEGTPSTLAVSQATHHFYVVSANQNGEERRVFNFEANGQVDPVDPELTGAPSEFEPVSVAVDNSGGAHSGYIYASGSLYIFNEHHTRTEVQHFVQQFSPGGQATSVTIGAASLPPDGTPQSEGLAPVVNAGFSQSAVTVDDAGNVFVLEREASAIDEFSPTGQFIRQIAAGAVKYGASGIAVDSSGDVYLARGSNPAGLYELDALGQCVPVNCAPIDQAPISGLTVDSSTNTLLTVGQVTPGEIPANRGRINEYDLTTHALLGASQPTELRAPGGIGVNEKTSEAIVTDERPVGHATVQIYGPAEVVPDLTTLTATDVTGDSVTMNGEIGAAGAGAATCGFQYVEREEFEAHGFEGATEVPCSEGPFTGEALNPVHIEVDGIAGGVAYEYRIVGSNEVGSNVGEAAEFVTLGPTVSGVAASDVSETEVTLSGTVDPRGSATSYRFRYLTQFQFEQGGWAGSTDLPEGGAAIRLDAEGTGDLEAGESTFGTASLHAGASASGTGTLSATSTEITLTTEDGTFEVGQSIVGDGIPAGTTIAAVAPGALVLSDPATASGTGVALAAGASVVTSLINEVGTFKVGEPIFGAGIPAGTTVVAVGPEALVLSAPAQVSATHVALGNGSRVITSLHTEDGSFAIGQTIAGPGIPPDTKIVGVSAEAEALLLSAKVEQTASGAALTSTKPLSVSTRLAGLSPGTAYRFRLVAVSGGVVTQGEGVEFVTFRAAAVGLPDSRRYEQVTPVDKNGANVQGGINSVQAALDGAGITFFTNTGIPGGEGSQEFPSYLASRSASGWSTQGLLPPASSGPRAHVIGWTEDLTETFDFATQANEPGKLLRRSNADGALTAVATTAASRNPFAFAGASEGRAVALLESSEGGIVTGDLAGKQNVYAYDRDSGRLAVAGVLNPTTPGAEPAVPPGGAMAGPYDWFNSKSTTEPGGASRLYFTQDQHAISDTGERVFFTAGGTGQLYVRENPLEPQSAMSGGACSEPTKACTIRISAPEEGVTDPGTPVAFVGASSDGHVVFFLDRGKLTEDATGGSGYDLYRYDLLSGKLTDLTLDSTDKAGARVEGVLGISNSGEDAYFVAAGGLTSEAGPAPAKETNLYGLAGEEVHFIARLGTDAAPGENESQNWIPNTKVGETVGASVVVPHTSRLSADGQTLLFRSARRLTTYRNHEVPELYLYRAGAGIDCISCNPTGEAPTGPAGVQEIPNVGGKISRSSAFMTRNLSADGRRVIFDSADRLTPADENDVNDVYEWEEPGKGSCTEASSAYSSQDAGCLFLISGGAKEAAPSWFGDADNEGENVFFFTAQPLVGQDKDELVDIYDARVEGGLPAQEAVRQEPCRGEGQCLPGPIGLPQTASPGSSSAVGVNVTPAKTKGCKSGKVRKGGRCVSKAKKHHGRKKRSKRDKKHKRHDAKKSGSGTGKKRTGGDGKGDGR